MSRLGKRIVIELTHEDYGVLERQAASHRRTPQDQAATIVEAALRVSSPPSWQGPIQGLPPRKVGPLGGYQTEIEMFGGTLGGPGTERLAAEAALALDDNEDDGA